MKLTELIAVLSDRLARQGDLDVEVTWEGIFREITQDHIYRSRDNKILIDADDNAYKKKFIHPDEK